MLLKHFIAAIVLAATASSSIFASQRLIDIDINADDEVQALEIPKLIATGIDINLPIHESGRSYLHMAVGINRIRTVQALIQAGACVNAQDSEGITPLEIAAYSGHLNATQVLVEAGANVTIKNNHGVTALGQAAASGNLEIALLLINAGSDANAPSNAGFTPLHMAKRFLTGPRYQNVRQPMIDLLWEHSSYENCLRYFFVPIWPK